MNTDIYKVYAELDLSKQPAECRIMPITTELWTDFGILLEVMGFMAKMNMAQKDNDPEKMAEYIKQYILKCLADYKRVK